MDPPGNGNVIKVGEIEEAKEGGPLLHCDVADSEVVYKIAQALLPGLASACVDNTTGDLMRSSGSIAVDIRREMVDYLVQRSETFVAESVVLEGSTDTDVSDHPFDIISNFIDDFAASKRNFLSKVSGWLLSDRREDRIDDLMQEMELDGFWLIGRREAVAQTLLKNVDFKNDFHCNMKFKASTELDEHKYHCSFRTIICTHEGCDFRFSACHLEEHESVCPFKIIPCEQKCPASIMRREMDRHCITVCTMKLVNCPFYQVGCHSTIPQCQIDEHHLGNLQSHILHVLRISHRGFSENSLKKRLDEIGKISASDNLASLRDARSLTNAVKNYERSLGPIEEIKVEPEPHVEDGESKEKKESSSSSSSEENLELAHNNEEVLKSTVKEPEPKESSEKSDSTGSPVSERGVANESLSREDSDKSPKEKKKSVDVPGSERELVIEPPLREDHFNKSPKEKEKHENSYPRKKENAVTQFQPESTESLDQDEKFQKSATEQHRHSMSSSDKSTSPVKRYEMAHSPIEIDNLSESSGESEEHDKSLTKKNGQEVSHSKRHEFENFLERESTESSKHDEIFQISATEIQKQIDHSADIHRQSTSSSDKSTSPAKRDVMVDLPTEMQRLSESSGKSEEHRESPTKKDGQENSHLKRHKLKDSLVKINEHENSPAKINDHESSSDESDD